MDIYSKKRAWKILLLIIASVIVGVSLWFTNDLVSKLSSDERVKLKIWAEAIQQKANLVRYTGDLFEKISNEERKKVELWAEATRQLARPDYGPGNDYTFVLKVVADNTTVPIILADEKGYIIAHRNIDSLLSTSADLLKKEMKEMAAERSPIEISIYGSKKNYLYYKDSRLFSELKSVMDDNIRSFISEIVANSVSVPVIYTEVDRQTVLSFGNIDSAVISNPSLLRETIEDMEQQNKPVEIHLSGGKTSYIFYKDSYLLTQLKYFPVLQFGMIGLFVFISYWLFSISRTAEQNQVWVGMAKETAHQLGTPLSSLIAWVELLKEKPESLAIANEIRKDVSRLELITDRFSKIGSDPALKDELVISVIENTIDYLNNRTSEKIVFVARQMNGENITAKLNVPLFEWVIENLSKNAIDAMNGEGSIAIEISDQNQFVYVDVSDTGKGISPSKFNTIFEPGYTTKARGWGLGLSLCKRIVENYHDGKIFVKRSEPGKGTTFRIVLRK